MQSYIIICFKDFGSVYRKFSLLETRKQVKVLYTKKYPGITTTTLFYFIDSRCNLRDISNTSLN